VLLSLAGAVVVAVLAVWIAKTLSSKATGSPRSSPASASPAPTIPPPSSPADIAAFLGAERRMLFGTWVIHAEFGRRTASGRELDSPVRRAQRPPDTLNEGPSTADGRRAGRLVACATGPTGGLVCKDTGPAPPFVDHVNGELDSLKSYLVAPLPLYRVGAAPDAGPGQCWRLLLAAPRYPSPPYGAQAVFCFDPATGAPSFSQIVRPEATDTTRVTQIGSAVTDADLTVDGLGR
jgi:hypothetical protein